MRLSFVGALPCVVGSVLTAGCDDEVHRAVFVEPAYGEPCRFAECSVNGECRLDEAGTPECLCTVGYEGSTCDSCEVGFHRDARDRCVPDKTCAEQDENPCGMYGACAEEDGVIACACEEGYVGPRCTLCADRYARDLSGRCLPLFIIGNSGSEPPSGGDGATSPTDSGMHHDGMTPSGTGVDAGDTGTCPTGYAGPTCMDCAAGYQEESGSCVPDPTCDGASCPQHASCRIANGRAECQCDPGWSGSRCDQCGDIGSQSISFEGASAWPASANTCGGRTEMTLSGLTLRSRQGSGTVLVCAPSTFNGLASRHVQLEASATLDAQLTFARPVILVSFDYGAGLSAVSLEVLVDGSSVRSLELARKSKATVTLELPEPASTIALRSRSSSTQTVGIDNIVYHYQQCE